MTPTENLAKLTAEGEHENNVLPLDDDELEAVAGGGAKADAEAAAIADGRTYRLRAGISPNGMCRCNNKFKWARTYDVSWEANGVPRNTWGDIKCYKCGQTYSGASVSTMVF